MRCTATSELWPRLAFTLFHASLLLAREAASVSAAHPAYATRTALALELLASITQHPATWHVYRARAARLSAELQPHLPPEAVAAALARGTQGDWQASVARLAAELARVCRSKRRASKRSA